MMPISEWPVQWEWALELSPHRLKWQIDRNRNEVDSSIDPGERAGVIAKGAVAPVAGISAISKLFSPLNWLEFSSRLLRDQ